MSDEREDERVRVVDVSPKIPSKQSTNAQVPKITHLNVSTV